MSSKEVVLIKFGGSLITDKSRPETPRLDVIERLARELDVLDRPDAPLVVLGHGSGSFGHVAAQQYHLLEGAYDASKRPGVSATQYQAARLHHLVLDALQRCGRYPYSLSPSSCMVMEGREPASFYGEPLHLALQRGLLPVCYGDVVLDRTRGVSICSTETVMVQLVPYLREKGYDLRRMLWLGNTDGIYDASGRMIPRVSAENVEAVRKQIGAPAGVDVTGGMRHRLDTALQLAKWGILSLILNGRSSQLLRRALLEDNVPGTEIAVASR